MIVVADPSLSLKLRAFVTDAARALDKAKMMRFDEKSGNFYCTELGRIASHFYIQYSSVETYNEMLKRHMNDCEIIEMVARSSEFENIVVRDEEQNELETLARQSCPLEIKGGATNKYGKISILIQLYISRGSIDTFSLVSDAAYISASLARIIRALFEICLRRGWCEMTLFMLEYCKAVDRQIWPHQHPLRQFDKDLSAEILRKLEEHGADLDHLQEMEEKDIGALIRYAPGGRLVKQYLGYFPWIQLSATVSPITRTVLKVDLVMTPDFTWKDRFHGAAQRWWILVEDSESDHIYHSELFSLTKRMARGEPQKLSFTVPIFEPHPPQYYIRAVSDSWLQAEAFYCISFQKLALPLARTTHTELLDLKPLPVSALGNTTYEALYKFSHFNPIQTQIFHVLYHTDNNVLLGAPTGSGKTISAELAMLRLFNTQPDMKVIYIAPLKAIVRERMSDWRNRLVSQLGKKMVEMTGDYTPDLMALLSADIIISTPEKWDGISRNWHSRSYVTKVGLMILDEIHLLGADRGPILEVIVSRMRYISSQTERAVRFVGLSTALANARYISLHYTDNLIISMIDYSLECSTAIKLLFHVYVSSEDRDLADWLGVGEIGLFNFKPSGYPGKFYCPRMNSMNKPAYAAICTHSPTKPVLIFVSSRRQTRLTALDLIQFAASDEHPRQFLSMPDEDLQMVLSQVTDPNLRHTLQFGIGLHHAGLNERDRSIVEELFANNKIQAHFLLLSPKHVLVCTSTLAWGVNLPAHLVIIKVQVRACCWILIKVLNNLVLSLRDLTLRDFGGLQEKKKSHGIWEDSIIQGSGSKTNKQRLEALEENQDWIFKLTTSIAHLTRSNMQIERLERQLVENKGKETIGRRTQGDGRRSCSSWCEVEFSSGEVDEPKPTGNREGFKRGGRVEYGPLMVERWLHDEVSEGEMEDGRWTLDLRKMRDWTGDLAIEGQFIGSGGNRGEVLQNMKVIGEEKGTIVGALESRRSIFRILMVEIHMSGWTRWSTTFRYTKWQGPIGFLLYASTLMERLIAGGDGSKLNMSNMVDKWVGQLSNNDVISNEEVTSDEGELRVAELGENNCEAELSLNAMSGVSKPSTMRLMAWVGKFEVSMLVDSGSSQFHEREYLGVDVVLGNAWLKSIGKVVTDFDAMTMEFKLGGRKRTWAALPFKEIKQCEAQMIERLCKRSAQCFAVVNDGD
ncbi:hypothetical protein EZV62_024113 [Acer yangbiense]|uniref:Helicase ATP-binding domain-containing protein n=1 Tax=Acer yangbiense TaxID=1000413 RepID=A0A5C7H4E5_9ROSI|nr:hypothetical protein EZV62_024113 [Acer yangbiense]